MVYVADRGNSRIVVLDNDLNQKAVYDTVGALGVPLAKATNLNEPIVGFHDTTLGDLGAMGSLRLARFEPVDHAPALIRQRRRPPAAAVVRRSAHRRSPSSSLSTSCRSCVS